MHSLIDINFYFSHIILTSFSVKESILRAFKSSPIFNRSIRLLSNNNEKKGLENKNLQIKDPITSAVINKILINQGKKKKIKNINLNSYYFIFFFSFIIKCFKIKKVIKN